MTTPHPPRTVRVRIALAVDEYGEWVARGVSEYENAMLWANGAMIGSRSHANYWIEADVPVPVVTTVQGEVKKAEAGDGS